MTVSYTMTPADHWRLNFYVMTHDAKQGGLLAIAVLVIPVMCLQSQLAAGKPFQTALGAAIMVLLLSLGIGYPMLRYIAWTKFRKLPAHTRTVRITLANDGVHVTTSKAAQTLKWNAIHRVCMDRQTIYLFLSPRVALVAPLRGFASREDARQFEQFAREHTRTK